MNEPVYEFVKGEGWLPSSANIIDMGDGRRFRLTLRKPVPGERVMQIRHYHPTLANLDDTVNMDMVKLWFIRTRPRLDSFYLVPRRGYLFEHFTIVVEAV